MVRLELVEYHMQKLQVKNIIEKHHSYVPSSASVGRRIDWLIYHSDYTNVLGIEEPVGMIGIGSSVYPPPKDLLNYIGMSKSEYKDNFNSFANNWRFCMKEQIPNAGSQILKQLRQHAPVEWHKKYKNFLTHLLTFVGGGNNGAVYKADNWDMVGYTSGLPSHNMVSMKWNSKEELKDKFVKPTGENKKLIFVTRVK